MNQFEKYITLNKIEDNINHVVLSYIDTIIQPNNNTLANSQQFSYGTTQVMSKNIKISNDIIMDNIEDEILRKIIDIASRNRDNSFEIDDINIEPRKVLSKIMVASNKIYNYGRIGPATTVLMSEKTFYDFRFVDIINNKKVLYDLELVFSEKVSDIYVFRTNRIDQPGIQLFHNNGKYSIEEVGNNVSDFYIKIGLSQRLKRKQKLDSL